MDSDCSVKNMEKEEEMVLHVTCEKLTHILTQKLKFKGLIQLCATAEKSGKCNAELKSLLSHRVTGWYCGSLHLQPNFLFISHSRVLKLNKIMVVNTIMFLPDVVTWEREKKHLFVFQMNGDCYVLLSFFALYLIQTDDWVGRDG